MNEYPHHPAAKLYLYTDFVCSAWATTPENWRKLTGRTGIPIRVVNHNATLPAGYGRTGQGLAHEPIVRKPRTQEFIAALSPKP